jgi:hypothetical protein
MTDDGPFTDDDIEQYEQELADLSEKDLLVHILVELQGIRYYLQTQAQEPQEENERPEQYECKLCGAVVPEDERGEHSRGRHGAPPGISVEGEFVEVDK